MQGEKVIVRARGGKPEVSIVQASNDKLVWVAKTRRAPLQCYSRGNVFRYQDLPEGVEGAAQDETFWSSLTPY